MPSLARVAEQATPHALAPARKPPAGQIWTPTFAAAGITWLKLADPGWCPTEKWVLSPAKRAGR